MEPTSTETGIPSSSELAEYFGGDASHEMRGRIDAWVARDPAHARELGVLREAWAVLGTVPAELENIDATGAWTQVAAQLDDRLPPASAKAPRPPLKRRQGRLLAMGGALVAGALALVVRTSLTERESSSSRIYHTASGQRSTIVLADGSRITLAPQSRLEVVGASGENHRTVVLQGEAYFSVTPRTDATLLVKSGAVSIRVLGTAFNVRHYGEDRDVQIAVVSGKVAVHGRTTSATLAGGMFGRATDSTVTTIPMRDSAIHTDWTRGRLVFESAPVPAMLATVGRWYGYEFKIADSTLAKQDVSTVLSSSTPDETMLAIRELLDVTMTFEGRVVTLHTRKPQKARGGSRRERTHIPSQSEVGR
jgi:transmembrane sensor